LTVQLSPLTAGHGHASPDPGSQEVNFELGNGGQDVESHRAHRAARRGRIDPRSPSEPPIAPASGTDRAGRSSSGPRARLRRGRRRVPDPARGGPEWCRSVRVRVAGRV